MARLLRSGLLEPSVRAMRMPNWSLRSVLRGFCAGSLCKLRKNSTVVACQVRRPAAL